MFIGEASKLSGATQRAIRLYESIKLLKVARSGSYRVYSKENVETIKVIKEAQSLGVTLAELLTLLNEQQDFDWYLMRDFLNEKYRMAEKEIARLEKQKSHIILCQSSIDQCLKALDSDL
ncbi:MerR family transcriptional regulator [Colwellia sp. D2M02]|uniref:MerR family transcriptional regulator n=1 Tax=Colwellia sp. D2M02 TaxID=2841562 RepID=UPI001C09F282|nr:MerR family transcriptional regulator [Colwellia sp. D2M02]MBU2892480.1 MerR family transcriptional regulator [Colwellia sp. D2M02]